VDDVARFNRDRWEELVREQVSFSRPWLDLDEATARERVDREGMLGDIAGRDVLCLAGGGGQQSAAFALLGARVTVLDFSAGQLDHDREAAAHYGTEVTLLQGDMRDLSAFRDDAFDLVWHAHSLSFVPDPRPIFDGVARVLRRTGLYRLYWTNPFVHGLWQEEWNGRGYPLGRPYVDRAEIVAEDPCWDVHRPDGSTVRVAGPREWRHALGSVVGELIGRGFRLLSLEEDAGDGQEAEPGSWAHFKSVAPPWLISWWRLEGTPDRRKGSDPE